MSPINNLGFEYEYIFFGYRMLPFIFTLIGVGCSLFLIYNSGIFFWGLLSIQRFLGAKWFFDIIYNNIIVLGILNYAYKITFKLVDRGFIEWLGSIGISRKFKKISHNFTTFQSGFLYHIF